MDSIDELVAFYDVLTALAAADPAGAQRLGQAWAAINESGVADFGAAALLHQRTLGVRLLAVPRLLGGLQEFVLLSLGPPETHGERHIASTASVSTPSDHTETSGTDDANYACAAIIITTSHLRE